MQNKEIPGQRAQKRGVWLIVLCIVLVSGASFALDPEMDIEQYLYRAWTQREGFPQNTVQAIVQTKDGYLWFGTQSGLARYNGHAFTNFTPDMAPGLVGGNITALHESDDGTLWVGSEVGLSRYRDGRFEELSREKVTTIAEDRKGNIWIGSSTGDVSIYNGGKFENVVVDPQNKSLWVEKIVVAKDGAIWIGSTVGVYRAQNGGKSFEHFTVENGLPGLHGYTLFEDADKTIWVGTEAGMARFVDGKFEVPEELLGLTMFAISVITQDQHGVFWLGAIKDGFFRVAGSSIEKVGGIFSTERNIFDIFEDKEDNLWVGTAAQGAVQIREPKLVTYAPNSFPASNLSWCILEDSKGNRWQCNNSGVVMYSANGYTNFEDVPGGPNQPIMAIFESRDGRVWLGTDGDGPMVYDGEKFETLADRIPEMAGRRLRAVSEDAAGRILIGTRTNGLFVLKGDKVVAHYHAQNGLNSNRVTSITTAEDGRIVLTTGKGLMTYADGKLKDEWSNFGIPKEVLYQPLHEDGNIWFGSVESGLFLLRDNKLFNFGVKQGIPDPAIMGQLIHNDKLWLACNHGIIRVDKQELLDVAAGKEERLDAKLFGSADGLYTSECNGGVQNNVQKTSDGKMWFACMDGAVMIDQNRMFKNGVVPPVYIESVEMDGQPLEDGAEVEYANIRYTFSFAALSYVGSEEVRVEHKLMGFDDDWILSNKSRTATYTNLRPGEYTLRVKAANTDGVWNEKGARFQLKVKAPYYHEKWFLGALGALLLFLLIIAFSIGVKAGGTERA